MILSVVRQMAREGRKPARDVVVAMFADEEAGGGLGARWAVDHRPELFEGATEAISEVGGFSVDVDGHRAYLLQTAEKGLSLDAARRRRSRGARQPGQPRQRGDPPGRGGGAARAGTRGRCS